MLVEFSKGLNEPKTKVLGLLIELAFNQFAQIL